ncbi:MAG: hypothetical protein NXI01_08820 [Gammaproteobacteria bacterium]|nr:hypothetical protein [Gammaproteobacteria bacterium]
MGSDLPRLLSLLSIGVMPRYRDGATIVLQELIKDKNQYQVGLDANGEYTFTEDAFCFSSPDSRVFYDGAEKVLAYIYDGQNLSLQVFTTTQTNLFFDMDTDSCRIQAKGAICVKGNAHITSDLNIEAQALILGGQIHCQKRMTLHAEEGLNVLGEIEAKQLHITARLYSPTANITVHEHYDIAAQVFRTSGAFHSKAHTLRLIAKVCGIEGNFEVNASSFLVAQHLILGSLDNTTLMQLPPQHHIHVGDCAIEGQTKVSVGVSGTVASDAQWLIDDKMVLGESSTILCYHSSMQCKKMENQGGFLAEHCELAIRTLHQKNVFQSLHTSIASKTINMESGQFLAIDTQMTAQKVVVFVGDFVVRKNSTLALSDALLADKEATLTIKSSSLNVERKISLQGTTHIEKAHIRGSVFSTYQETNIKQSELVVDTLQLHDQASVIRTDCKAKHAIFFGQLHLDDVVVDAQSVEYQVSNACISRNYVSAAQILLRGGSEKEKLTFEKSRLVARSFTVFQHVVAKETTFVGVDDAGMCHSVNGHLTLEKSRFLTDSRIHSLLGTSIHPCEFSTIHAGVVDTSGDLTVDQAWLRCTDLQLNHTTATVRGGRIDVSRTINTQKATLIVDDNSSVSAAKMVSRQSQLRLKKSKLCLSQKMMLGWGAEVQSEHSNIAARSVTLHGSVELIDSLLSTEELMIYERFTAQHSMVQSDKNISFAVTAKVN